MTMLHTLLGSSIRLTADKDIQGCHIRGTKLVGKYAAAQHLACTVSDGKCVPHATLAQACKCWLSTLLMLDMLTWTPRSPRLPTRSPSVRQIAFTRRSGQAFRMDSTRPAYTFDQGI